MTTTNPVVLYVDDEPRNLSLMEVLLGEDYDLHCFESPMEAIKWLKTGMPTVIITDQRMPGMTGLEFLEVAAEILPDSPRIVLTGQTNEETMIKLVRKTQIFDYITKPLREDELLTSVAKAVEKHQAQHEIVRMVREIEEKNLSLEDQKRQLELQNSQLMVSQEKERAFRREAEAWASTEVIKALVEDKIVFPIKKDIVGITFDIVNSSQWHGVSIEGTEVRSEVVNLFTGLLLKYRGIQENHGGDAAFGHFGAFDDLIPGLSSAYAVAQEFRASLRNLSRRYQIDVECGVAIHLIPQATIDVHQVVVERSREVIVKKFLSSSSLQIDSLFRLEKLSHQLPGSNIILTESVFKQLHLRENEALPLGYLQKGLKLEAEKIYIVPSFHATPELIEAFRQQYFLETKDQQVA